MTCCEPFDGVRIFSATKARDREELGEVITDWLRRNPDVRVVDKIVTQSSDREFHCLSITLFYQVAGGRAAEAEGRKGDLDARDLTRAHPAR